MGNSFSTRIQSSEIWNKSPKMSRQRGVGDWGLRANLPEILARSDDPRETLRQVIGALDHLFDQTPEGQYQPLRAGEEVVHSVTREQVDRVVREMINSDYPNNGEKIWNALNGAVELPATFDRETLHRILANSDANSSSQRTLLTRLNLVGDRPLCLKCLKNDSKPRNWM